MTVPGILTARKDGNNINIKGYQHFAAWWMLTHEMKFEYGGILGDEMGFGKTLTMIYMIVLYYLLVENQEEVRQSRELEASGEGEHLRLGQAGKCNRSQHFGFQCSCEQGSLAARKITMHGATLIVSVPAVISSWRDEFVRWVDQDVAPLRVVTMHESGKGDDAWSRGDSTKFQPSFAQNIEELDELNDFELPRSDLPYWHDTNIESAMEILQPFVQHNQHALVMISTWSCAKSRIMDKLQIVLRPFPSPPWQYTCKDKTICPKPTGSGICQSATHKIQLTRTSKIEWAPSIQLSRVLVDESHLMKSLDHSFITRLTEQVERQKEWYGTSLCLWPVSGTPYSSGPNDLKLYMKFSDAKLYGTYSKHSDSFERLTKRRRDGSELTAEELATLEQDFKSITAILETHMIRRDNDTKDKDGTVLVKLPPLSTVEVEVKMTNTKLLDEALNGIKSTYLDAGTTSDGKPDKNTEQKMVGSMRLCRIFLSFPWLSTMDGPDFKMHSSKYIIKKGYWTSDKTPYDTNLQQIYDSSEKFQKLVEIIDTFDQRPIFDSKRPLDKTSTKTCRQKLIFCSADPVTCLVAFKVIWNYEIEIQALTVHSYSKLESTDTVQRR